MAQLKPEFSALDEFADIAQKLIDKYPEVFGGIDIDTIKCVTITNKDCPERRKNKPYEVKGVPQPIRMDCSFSYYVILYQSDWVERDEPHKAILVAAILQAIPSDIETEGKVNTYDLKDFYRMQSNFGVDYLESDDIPDLLADGFTWNL